MPWLVKAKSRLILAYFFLSIGVLGLFTVYLLALPAQVLGKWVRPLRRIGGRAMRFGLQTLMATQPWFNCRADLGSLEALLREGSGALIVANHRSHLDVFCFLWALGGVRVLAKRSLFFVPFLGFAMWGTRQIPVRRGDVGDFVRGLDRVSAGVRDGDLVIVFPELTRCPSGLRGTQSFALAPFWTALRDGLPIVPVVVRGTDAVWPKEHLGILSRDPISLKALPMIQTATFATAEALRAEIHGQLNRELGAEAC